MSDLTRELKFWFFWIFGVLGALYFLTGCSSQQNQGEELAVAMRGGYLASDQISLSCTVTADYGERVYRFSFDSITEGEKTQLTLTAPAELAGLVATIENKSGDSQLSSQLSYEGVLVDTGALSDDGLSPITAVPALISVLKSGYIQQIMLGENELVLTCGDPDTPASTGQEFVLTLDAATGDLQQGEIFVDGFRVIDCEILEISWNGPVSS